MRTPWWPTWMAPFLLSLSAASAPLFGGTNVYAALGRETWVGLLRSAVRMDGGEALRPHAIPRLTLATLNGRPS